jgi:hypothetical protein
MASIATVLLGGALLCGSVSAHSAGMELAKGSTWDVPAKGILESYTIEDRLLAAKAEIQWTSAQLKQFQSDDFGKLFFPALEFQTDGFDPLRVKFMFTDLPGAKFIRDDAAYGAGERIKVTTLDIAHLVPDKPYEFYATWLHVGNGDPKIELHSFQGYAQPNGPLNELPATNHTLAAFSWKDAEALEKKYRDLDLSEDFDNPFGQYVPGERQAATKLMSYAEIRSKADLDRYKKEAAERVRALADDETVRFAITSGDPYGISSQVLLYSGLTVTQVYAAGYAYDSLGKIDKKHPYTLSWFDDPSGSDSLRLLNIGNRLGTRGIITEIEGTATGEQLKKVSAYSEVDTVDIEQNGRLPTGISRLTARYEPK